MDTHLCILIYALYIILSLLFILYMHTLDLTVTSTWIVRLTLQICQHTHSRSSSIQGMLNLESEDHGITMDSGDSGKD